MISRCSIPEGWLEHPRDPKLLLGLMGIFLAHGRGAILVLGAEAAFCPCVRSVNTYDQTHDHSYDGDPNRDCTFLFRHPPLREGSGNRLDAGGERLHCGRSQSHGLVAPIPYQ